MKSILYVLISFFVISCSSIDTYKYEISSSVENKNIESILIFNVRESLFNNSITIDIQSFPKYSNKIKSYEMVFDMKFREDYVSDSNICIGPLWEEFGSGEFSIQLLKADEFKNKITGIYDQASQDECKNYFYYLRNLVINLDNGDQIFIGVATDYAKKYPDAPYYWVLEKNNIIDKNGSTNIEKYSLYFELSK